MRDGQAVVVLVTVPSADAGERIARAVVEERLAACVNIVPGLRSIFEWEGRIQDESELLLVLKTDTTQLAALESRVCALHPYTVPEVLALPVLGGHAPYLAWLRGAVGPSERGGGDQPDQE